MPENVGSTAEDKPWLFQAIPEFHKKSAKDTCLGQDKVLCIIIFSPTQLGEKLENELRDLKKELDVGKSNFLFKITWINSSVHKDWVQKMGVEDPSKLNVRVLRTGRRIKYVEMSEDFSTDNVLNLIEKIIGGDARSVTLRNGLPVFAEDK